MRPQRNSGGERPETPLTTAELHLRALDLGGEPHGDGLRVTFFGQPLLVLPERVRPLQGPPISDTVVDILLDYIHRRPAASTGETALVTFRELAGAGPLAVAFANNTHKTISRSFGDDPMRLADACRRLAGRTKSTSPGYDLTARFQALPKVPAHLRFNAAEAPFPAEAALLFQKDAPDYLGLRSLHAVATYLTGHLIRTR
ncbi:MAG: DUF3786 domain-containing protein [Desulfosarcinaceae bacterium]|nr:DUF3786 domain-containing protein [Desulfosarcinaceae bacterium]